MNHDRFQQLRHLQVYIEHRLKRYKKNQWTWLRRVELELFVSLLVSISSNPSIIFPSEAVWRRLIVVGSVLCSDSRMWCPTAKSKVFFFGLNSFFFFLFKLPNCSSPLVFRDLPLWLKRLCIDSCFLCNGGEILRVRNVSYGVDDVECRLGIVISKSFF